MTRGVALVLVFALIACTVAAGALGFALTVHRQPPRVPAPHHLLQVAENEVLLDGCLVSSWLGGDPCPDSPCFALDSLREALEHLHDIDRDVYVQIGGGETAQVDRLVFHSLFVTGYRPILLPGNL